MLISRVLAALSGVLIAAAAEPEKSEPAMAEVKARASGRDVKFPVVLVERLEKEYKQFLLKQEGGAKDEVRRGLLNLTAEFTRRGGGGALTEDTRVRLPTGGGVVDLADILNPLRGSFTLRLAPKSEDGGELRDTRVFFVSHAKERVLDGETFGDGCHRYMEITTKFHRLREKGGLPLYTADQRDVSVLGGTFLFVRFAKEALQVASVSFTDSRYPDLLCGGH